MRKYCFVFWFIMAILPVQAAQTPQIYKWTDSNGNVTFSDKPHEGAEEIVLPKVQTYSSPKIPNTEHSFQPASQTEEQPYDRITIVQPDDQETIRNPQGYVSVIVDLKPKLRRGDNLQLLFDGSVVESPAPTTVFALQDIVRGSHTIAAQVLDAKGKVLNTSNTITIFMQQPRAGMGTRSP